MKITDSVDLMNTMWRKDYEESLNGSVRIPQLPTPFLRKHITTITSTTNAGKSTFARALTMELVSKGKNVVFYSTEENHEDFYRAFKNVEFEDESKRGKFHITVRDNVSEIEINEAFDYEDIDFVIFDYANTASLDAGKDYARSLNTFMELLLKKVKKSKCHAFVIFQANRNAYSNNNESAIQTLRKHPGLLATFSEGGIRGIAKAYNSYFIERVKDDNGGYNWLYSLCKTRINFDKLYITSNPVRCKVELGDPVQYVIDLHTCKFTKAAVHDG